MKILKSVLYYIVYNENYGSNVLLREHLTLTFEPDPSWLGRVRVHWTARQWAARWECPGRRAAPPTSGTRASAAARSGGQPGGQQTPHCLNTRLPSLLALGQTDKPYRLLTILQFLPTQSLPWSKWLREGYGQFGPSFCQQARFDWDWALQLQHCCCLEARCDLIPSFCQQLQSRVHILFFYIPKLGHSICTRTHCRK